MNWEKIRDWLIEHKQYVIIGVIFIFIVFWNKYENHAPTVDDQLGIKPTHVQKNTSTKQKQQKNEGDKPQLVAKNSDITCDISGAIKHQGVYTLKNGARLQELITAAGGIVSNAQLKNVNRALILKDQDKIHIPYKGEKIKISEIIISANSSRGEAASTSATAVAATNSNQSATGKVNINTANEQDLQKLTGIGEKKAAQILAYRQKNGLFKRIEDLKQVSGIGDKTFAALKNQLEI